MALEIDEGYTTAVELVKIISDDGLWQNHMSR